MKKDGTIFDDHEVHRYLREFGVKNPEGEWFACSVKEVQAAYIAVKTGEVNEEHRTLDFKMRPEQREAVEKTAAYFNNFKQYKENKDKTPHFLWNAKMRFGKTFAAYQLAKKDGLEKSVGAHLQARRAKRMGGRLEKPCRFCGLAVHQAWRLNLRRSR